MEDRIMLNRNLFVVLAAVFALGLFPKVSFGHCQIPCGIYGDETRFTLMREDVTTIEKSMKQIVELSGADKPDMNQIVRWTVNKDEHAAKLTEIVTYYFMAQRIKPVGDDDKAGRAKYLTQIELLHRMVVTAMKCKQTTDLEHVKELRALIDAFEHSYLGDKSHKH
jgi:nickel superoxide dismutase